MREGRALSPSRALLARGGMSAFCHRRHLCHHMERVSVRARPKQGSKAETQSPQTPCERTPIACQTECPIHFLGASWLPEPPNPSSLFRHLS